MDRLLRVNEVAERLGLMPGTVRKLIRSRHIPAVRPTKRAVRVREEDVEALIRVGYRPNGEASRVANPPSTTRQPHGRSKRCSSSS